MPRKDTTLSVRLETEHKEFYIANKGLAARVLKDFYNQFDTILHNQKKKAKKDKSGKD